MSLVKGSRGRRVHLYHPFLHLARVDTRLESVARPLRVIVATFIFLVTLWLKLLKDRLELLAVAEQADPVPLVRERRLQNPPCLFPWLVTLRSSVERFGELVEVVLEQLIELVRERERERERAQGRMAERRGGVLGEVQRLRVCEVILPDQPASSGDQLASTSGEAAGAPFAD